MAQYIEKARLVELLVESKETKRVGDELARVFLDITDGLVNRYFRTHPDPDDLKSAALLVLCRASVSPALDTTKGVFAYLTTCAINEMRRVWNKDQDRTARNYQLAGELFNRGDLPGEYGKKGMCWKRK